MNAFIRKQEENRTVKYICTTRTYTQEVFIWHLGLELRLKKKTELKA